MRIVPGAELRAHFREQVTTVSLKRGIRMDEEVEFYLVDLLARFATASAEEAPEEAGGEGRTPLAFLLKAALEAPPPRRVQILRYLGDFALYIAGFFGDSLGRSLVDVDYYVSMGGRAYRSVSDTMGNLQGRAHLQGLFAELGERFDQWVTLFDEISETAIQRSNRDLLRMYERYLHTGGERLRERLAARGIIPATAHVTKFVN